MFQAFFILFGILNLLVVIPAILLDVSENPRAPHPVLAIGNLIIGVGCIVLAVTVLS